MTSTEKLNKIFKRIIQVQQSRSPRSASADAIRKHKNTIKLKNIYIKGKLNKNVKLWLQNPATADIQKIDDIPLNVLNKLRYGKILTKSERVLLSRLRKINNKRSTKELIKDLLITHNVLNVSQYKKWIKNPKKYDIENIDTIPKAIAGMTATQLKRRKGSFTKSKYNRLSSSTRGLFKYGKTPKGKDKNYIRINRLIKGSKISQLTKAHEVGHLYDYVFLNFKKQFTKPSKTLKNELKKVALYFKPIEKGSTKRHEAYRLKNEELFADAFAFYIYNPAKTKRISPYFVKWLNSKDKKLKGIIGRLRYANVRKLVTAIKKRRKIKVLNHVKKKKKKN